MENETRVEKKKETDLDNNCKTLTKGAYIVGIGFNPSKSKLVNEIKIKTAELINLVDTFNAGIEYDKVSGEEIKRLKAIAITNYENSAMWAVKAVTK